jgi:hypothetical protein
LVHLVYRELKESQDPSADSWEDRKDLKAIAELLDDQELLEPTAVMDFLVLLVFRALRPVLHLITIRIRDLQAHLDHPDLLDPPADLPNQVTRYKNIRNLRSNLFFISNQHDEMKMKLV